MGTIIKLSPDNIKTNVLTKCHKDWAKCMSTRVLTRFYYSHIMKNAVLLEEKCPSPAIIRINDLTWFHNDWTINVTSRELTRKNAPPPPPLVAMFFNRRETFGNSAQTSLLTRKNAPPTINKEKCPAPPGGHVFQRTGPKLELSSDIIRNKILTQTNQQSNQRTGQQQYFHEDWTKHLTSRVITKKMPCPLAAINNLSHKVKNAPPPGGHIFQQTRTIFEIIHNIISTIVLTKFHEDLTINMTSKVLTRKKVPSPGSHDFHITGIFFKLSCNTIIGYFENPELKAGGQGAAGPSVGPGDKGARGPQKLLDSTHLKDVYKLFTDRRTDGRTPDAE
ncbi:hypothetical protein DPMN_003055 [Dreissena polymorpha]|uniref:Uncharacterized protein n=1 Tax=Dreissena polymorpha TaxID=45954 RepID=A0A9D4ML63_DREPO|nr:hypothetical protein DPMN_003055 [Dreissena polymorpha]